jgi:leader peptidase (prepilin peptidase)/N-methyltransferase
VNPALIASLAAAGLLAGWPQRAVIVRLAVPAEVARDQAPGPDWPRSDGPGPDGPAQDGPAQDGPRPEGPGRCPPALAVGGVTAVLLGALAARVHPGLVLAAACWLAACAVPLAFVDAAVRRLPDLLTGSAFAGTAALLLAAAAVGGTWHVLARAVLGGVALSGFYLVLAVISPSGMGMGDVKAAAGLGSMLAWRGWSALVAGGLAGFLFAAVYGTALLISGRATRKQQIPFGPFMIAGAFLAVLLS